MSNEEKSRDKNHINAADSQIGIIGDNASVEGGFISTKLTTLHPVPRYHPLNYLLDAKRKLQI